MKENIFELKSEFEKIKKMNWVKAVNNDFSGSGLTFEKLLGKEIDELPFPDYKGIEIKTKISQSRYATTLFCSTPTTGYIKPMETLVNTYGYYSRFFLNEKVLMGIIDATKLSPIGNNYLYKVIVDREKKRIQIKILNKDLSDTNELIYWDFDDLEKIIRIKLRTLALVVTQRKIVENDIFYRYTKLYIFEIKTFEDFIDLIEKGIISIEFCINRFKSGKRIGQIHDHGTAFRIYQGDLLKLYKNTYTFY